jgi:DNA-binding MarR family transcriptional regulator
MSPDKQLEDLLAVLVERFGAERSLGEVRAVTCALRLWREGRTFSVSDIAKATGTSKQTLSRWLQYRVEEGRVATQPFEDNSRRQEIIVTDPPQATRHLEPLAELFGCDVDSPRRVQ